MGQSPFAASYTNGGTSDEFMVYNTRLNNEMLLIGTSLQNFHAANVATIALKSGSLGIFLSEEEQILSLIKYFCPFVILWGLPNVGAPSLGPVVSPLNTV